MRRVLLLSIMSVFTIMLNASIIVNEVMTKNVTFLLNEDYNFEGWIELYNSSAEEEDISTLFLSDNPAEPYKWQMPVDSVLDDKEYIMPPHSYKIIYMDKLDKPFHASFKLDANGGTIVVTSGTGVTHDVFTYGESFRNTSIGRISDTEKETALFSHPTPAQENDLTSIVTVQTTRPQFSLKAGCYNDAQTVSITSDNPSARIYYTTDGSEPQPYDSLLYAEPLSISKSTALRAIAVVEGEMSSDITTSTYLFEKRTIDVPIVSLVTDRKYMYDDTIGFLVIGKNGAPVNGGCGVRELKANYMQDWDRPANFELIDNNEEQINQELKIGGFGACSRTASIKSIKAKANKVYGNNKLDYSIFKEKPALKWKSIVLRNSGNDFTFTMLRDGFIQSLVSNRFNIDHQAYQPASVFINGNYYGMLNIRERTNADFIYSNYGLDEEDIYIHQGSSAKSQDGAQTDYSELLDYVNSIEDMNAEGVIDHICEMVDIEELLNYLAIQVYISNRDWPGGNIKAWKKIDGGKWRWILYDTDFGFSLYEDNRNTNSLGYAAKNKFFAALFRNDYFKWRFYTKMVAHLTTTFSEERCLHVLDSIIAMSNNELTYARRMKGEAGSYSSSMRDIKAFAKDRSKNLSKIISNTFNLGDTCAFSLYSEVPGTEFILNDYERIDTRDFKGRYYKGEKAKVNVVPPHGYKFVRWVGQMSEMGFPLVLDWKCYHQGNEPTGNWKEIYYDDAKWDHNSGSFGFGFNNLDNTFDGKISDQEYIRSMYLRRTFSIDHPDSVGKLSMEVHCNDGCIVYVNGEAVYLYGLPENPSYSTNATTNNTLVTKKISFEIPKEKLVSGMNVIAVEVHNFSALSNNLYFSALLTSERVSHSNYTSTEPIFESDCFYGGHLKAIFEEDPEDNRPTLFLNEICATTNTYIDEARESEDWIEIYNDGTEPINLAGYYLSDERKNLTKYQIADTLPMATTIPAKGYIVFWADSEEEQGILHTNFSLSNSKQQTVSLSRIVDNDTIVIDSVRYKNHEKGESYARYQYLGSNDWTITPTPTFKNANKFPTDETIIYADDVVAQVYPNPVTDGLYVAFSWNEASMVCISDFTNRRFIQTKVRTGDFINLSDLKAGFYFVTIQNGNHTYTAKIIKK